MKKTLYILTSLLLFSCTSENIDPIVEEEIMGAAEVALPEPGEIVNMYFGGQEVPLEIYGDKYIYQGDIVLTSDMVSAEPQDLVLTKGQPVKSVGRNSHFWPNNTVYYSIDSNLRYSERVMNAIEHWEKNTQVRFVRRTTERNYVYFTTGSGCSSYLGMIGGKQDITLSTGCSTGNIIHEIGHAVGLFHEQARVDRDMYITINYENIQKDREHNFHTYAQMRMGGDDLTNYLDFNSIMMYDSYSFSKNGLPTITRKDGSTFYIQRNILSTQDLFGIYKLYPNNSLPTYVNGQSYYIGGLTVLRSHDMWYFRTIHGWKRVRLINNRFYWV